MRNIPLKAFSTAIHVVIWFVVVATIAAEVLPVFKEFLANTFGHHWIAKSDIAVILFVVVALLMSRSKDPEDVSILIRGVLISTLVGIVVIFAFYLAHFMGMV